MSLQETALLQQANYNVQQKAEIKRGQKETDQGFRQMFADCLKTLETRGSVITEKGVLNRALGIALHTLPAVLYKKMDPRELLDYRTYVGLAETENNNVTVMIHSDTKSLDKSSEVTIRLVDLNERIEINRHRGYAEVYSNYPVNLPTQYQRDANIFDLRNYQGVLGSLREFTRANPVPVPQDIVQFSSLNEDELNKQLKKVTGRRRFIDDAFSLTTVGLMGAFVLGAISRETLIMYSALGLVIASPFAHGRIVNSLEHRARIIENELAARGKQP